ncbi:CO(2)-response secreted protease-like [Musa acuminata AAA Group]|uniref:CO(2)-response secreted protease-like n=1 Tax=Musa acuminata AAA Group TaxID=214697 RepID=UPI0031CE45EC
MKGSVVIGIFLSLWSLAPQQFMGMQEAKREVYVIYMGAVPVASSGDMLRENHLQLLSSVLRRGQSPEKTLLWSYRHGFSGFAARLSKEEAVAISEKTGVVSVFLDPIYQLHTTRSWDFLRQTSLETDSKPDEEAASSNQTSDTIIGFLDTGVWPESSSFNDKEMGAVPGRWKGVCMAGSNFSASSCNKKLIGARYYSSDDDDMATPTTWLSGDSPRDASGHGTHTASTAAGSSVMDASYYGLARGIAKGGSTSSRIAMYRVCFEDGCPGSAILAGFDDAIADGVDLISVSLGASKFNRPDFAADPIAIGAFHAMAKGITVVCSAGNDGPSLASLVNTAPWILTVAATTIDRDFESDVVLGGNKAIKGGAINFSGLQKSPVYPLINGEAAKSNSSSIDGSASHCDLGTLEANKIRGKIVLCNHSTGDFSKRFRTEELKSSGAVGAIWISDTERGVADTYNSFPVTQISSQAADEILSYMNSTKNPVGTILATVTVTKYRPAPVVAYFSSRGPSTEASGILKPDVAAPGVNILAAWIPGEDSSDVPPGQKPSPFKLVSGTSMSCPHVAGVAATVKSWNPSWSPAAIRSAIMTTATQVNNDEAPLTTESGSPATPYDIGAGEVSPTAALQPGLVYEAGPEDYFRFLCNYGYPPSKLRLIADTPEGYKCPENSSKQLISDLNYPSIAISNFTGKESKIVNRIATNVGAEEDATYAVSVKSPPELDVQVVPNKLHFSKNTTKLSYQVIFSATKASVKGDLFGSITWSDGLHRVRSPFAVRGI